jgi:leucyl-tRNA synthetase
MDAWLDARLQTRLARLRSYMDEYDVRSYSNEVYFEVPHDLRWYLKRGGKNKAVLRKAIETWVTLMAPVTPHVAEELWESMGNERFVSIRQMPEGEVTEGVLLEEAKERLVEGLVADVSEILKVTGVKPSKLVVTTSPAWKREMLKDALAMPKGQLDISSLIKASMAKAKGGQAKKEVPAFAKDLALVLGRSSEQDRTTMSLDMDELSVLEGATLFLAEQFGCEVEVYSADDKDKYDPKGKAKFSRPGRPAVYVE